MEQNILLAHYSNYKIGGHAKFLCRAQTIEELKDAIRFAREKKLPVFVLGGGTNLVIRDEGFEGLVIKPELLRIERKGDYIHAGAGVPMHELLDVAAEAELAGLEWAGGLPGTFGGAIRGNAGAFGGEIKDSIHSVMSIDMDDPELRTVTRTNPECRFGYRSSIFKEKGTEIILEAALSLTPGNRDEIKKIAESRKLYRKERHPIEYPNVGSIFKNVPVEAFSAESLATFSSIIKSDPFPVVPVAYLIAEAGLKGISFGGAMISPKHPNFIVNVLGATCADVRGLIELMKDRVKEKFGVVLVEEVMYL